MNELVNIVWIGIGATAATDIWALLRRRLFGVAPPNYPLVGRWMGYWPRGHFRHESIAAAAPVEGEWFIGWSAHYLIGIAYAGLVPLFAGREWLAEPTPWPALFVGIGTVLAPFLIMQPGMGAGIAARRTPRPGEARLHSLLMHTVFGLGLYAAALIVNSLQPWSIR